MSAPVQVGNQIFIQREFLAKTPVDDLTGFMTKFSSGDMTLRIVENLTQFFSNANLMDAVNKGNVADANVIAKQRGFVLSENDCDTIIKFGELKKYIEDQFKSHAPAYVFAVVPEHFDIADITLTSGGSVKRSGGDRTIGLKTLKKLWIECSKFWHTMKETGDKTFTGSTVNASGYSNYPEVNAVRVSIGCQTIQRYELEQFALSQNWEFPS